MAKKFVESTQEMEKLLIEERIGYLGMTTDNNPYVIPLTYAYNKGKILFHGSLKGRRLEILRNNPSVCFTVSRYFGKMVSHPQGSTCHSDSDSVICFGKARIIDDIEERRNILNIFNHSLQPEAKELSMDDVKNCSAVEILVEEMTGRTERD